MSTRRARIKAVAVLPPRRKNADANKKTGSQAEAAEKELKSPKTPRSITTSTSAAPEINPQSLDPEVTDQMNEKPTQNVTEHTGTPKSTQNTPKSDEIITSTSAKSLSNSFASPPVKKSPRRPTNLSIFPLPSPVKSVAQIEDDERFIMKEHHIRTSPFEPEEPTTAKDIPDSFMLVDIPSLPESVTDDGVMDGIVPLQAAGKPKPLSLLKNEIISENAEVVFDPIVPLPSPSKVRPKLRPIPRLPLRRNSIQGSASESEDESRRALLGAPTPVPPRSRHDSHTSHTTLLVPAREVSRVRNDSVCSSVSQAAAQPLATSPVKEKHSNKVRRQEMSKRMWRRRRDAVKQEALTMYDLIFYNPTTNPIIPDKDEIQAKELNAKEEAARLAKAEESEEDVDDPPTEAPVPQIKLGPNGEIILDEKSLVIKQSDTRKVSSVVREGAWAVGSGGKYTRSARTADWSDAETVRFYRALAALGTDFSLMAQLFPGRTRKDLKLKFKKEERLNGGQVDKALQSGTTWDVAGLQDEFKEEREASARQAELARKKLQEDMQAEKERKRRAREMKMRFSKGSKAIEQFTPFKRTKTMELTADDIINRAVTRGRVKKPTVPKKQDNVLCTVEPPPPFATLTILANQNDNNINDNMYDYNNPLDLTTNSPGLATLSRMPSPPVPQLPVPTNIENGSLVVLRVNDPKSPSKTMLQTYISQGHGKLTPIALPQALLSSVMGYMKGGTPKSTISTASSPLLSPSSVGSITQDSATATILNPSPPKRQRHSSFTITTL